MRFRLTGPFVIRPRPGNSGGRPFATGSPGIAFGLGNLKDCPYPPAMRLARSTLLLSVLTLGGQVVAFAVQVLFAGEFGAGWRADALFAATAVPTFLSMALFASLGRAALPAFVEERTTHGELAWRTVAGVTNSSFILLGALAGLVTVFSEPVSRLLFPDFEPRRFELARTLVEVSIWAVPPAGAATVLAALQQGRRRFSHPALSTLAQPLGMLAGFFLLKDEIGVASLAVGLVAGTWVRLFILIPVFFRRGRWSPTLALDMPGTRRIHRLAPPLLLAAALLLLPDLLEKRFASGIQEPAEGPVSWLNYGRRTLNFLQTLMVGPVLITSYTLFAESAAAGKLAELRTRAWRVTLSLFLLLLPAGIAVGFLAPEVMGVAFERGEFDAEDTRQAATALRLLVPFLFLGAVGRVLTQAYLARRKTLVPLLTAFAGVALYAGLGGPVADHYGYRGLAVLLGASAGLTSLLTAAFLVRSLGLPRGEGLLRSLAGILLAGAVAAGALALMAPIAGGRGQPIVLRLLMLAVSAGGAGVIYLGVLAVTKNALLGDVIRSLLRRKPPPADPGAPPA